MGLSLNYPPSPEKGTQCSAPHICVDHSPSSFYKTPIVQKIFIIFSLMSIGTAVCLKVTSQMSL